ncbi:hypothetical protein MNBD_PLANCTO03-1210, partial [hydrothermal vent metagenome]
PDAPVPSWLVSLSALSAHLEPDAGSDERVAG